MQDYQTLALSYAEELSDLKRRYADLERHCRGLESKLSKTRGRMKMYRERCKARGDDDPMYAVGARYRWNRGPIQIRAEVA